jgi:hypothetical protein
MNRKRRSDDELIGASDHLNYEYWMFKSLAHGLASGICGQGVINNALLESFTIHARILLDFLYPSGRPKNDDVISDDFFYDPATWTRVRPQKSKMVQSIHRRVGKEVAHLTYARQGVTSESKPWQFIKIANEVGTVFDRFIEIVPRKLLGPRWNLDA